MKTPAAQASEYSGFTPTLSFNPWHTLFLSQLSPYPGPDKTRARPWVLGPSTQMETLVSRLCSHARKRGQEGDSGSSKSRRGSGSGLREASFPDWCPLPFDMVSSGAAPRAAVTAGPRVCHSSGADAAFTSRRSSRAFVQLGDGTLGGIPRSACLLGLSSPSAAVSLGQPAPSATPVTLPPGLHTRCSPLSCCARLSV